MTTAAKSPEEYLSALPADRAEILRAVRQVILANLPTGYEETMQGGMIAYVVPHRLYPAGYHCDPRQPLQYAALGSQKNYITLHLMTIYGDPATTQWFQEAFQKAGKKLDMGQACLRFKKLDDLPLDVIGQVIARVPVAAYLARVEKAMQRSPRRK
jgi:hypothetical protein